MQLYEQYRILTLDVDCSVTLRSTEAIRRGHSAPGSCRQSVRARTTWQTSGSYHFHATNLFHRTNTRQGPGAVSAGTKLKIGVSSSYPLVIRKLLSVGPRDDRIPQTRIVIVGIITSIGSHFWWAPDKEYV